MKIVSNIYKKTVLAATVALGALMSSCTDYLTIIPADVVVEENFWQTKDQVNGMLATSYLKLLSNDAVTKAIVWGEMRSDNMTYPSNYNTDIKNIVEANIIDENGYCNWGIFYEAINYANLVLESADAVVDCDPDFSEGDLAVAKGEMYAMRALCHFYLVRAFRDIPLALKSAKNDAEIPDYVQVSALEALDQIMQDLDLAENMVMKSGAFSSPQQNCGRITRNAVLAMKADVNLWRAAFATYYGVGDANYYYNECVRNCNAVIHNMDSVLASKDKNGKPGKPGDEDAFPYNLIKNEGEPQELTSSHKSTAYDDIFGAKNSSESIFELQVQGDNIKNGAFNGVYRVYGTEGNPGLAIVPQGFVTANYEEDDLRAYSYTNLKAFASSSTGNQNTCIAKYAAKASPATSYRKSDEWDANWIVYRRTDVLLMMAEALAARTNDDLAAKESDFRKAYDIVKAINYRSRIDTLKMNLNPWKVENYLNKDASLELVRKERLLELSYEGKRWFDLVRRALCEKSTDKIKFVADKVGSGAAVIKTKMSTIDGLFMPIHVDELRYNKNLKQNPAYKKEGSSMEMN